MGMAARVLGLAGAVLVAAGCAVHSPVVPDEPVTPPDAFSTGVTSPAGERGPWWKGLGDDRLERLMEEAFAGNLGVVRAYERVSQARAAARAAAASRLPNVNLSASGGQTRASSVTTDSYKFSAAASYEIDIWKKLKSSTDAARLDTLAATEDLKGLYISLSAELADLYYLAAEQRAQLELTDRTIAAFRDTLERVERRYAEGLVPALDVYQSRQNLAAALAQRPVFEANLEVAEHAASVLLGRPPGSPVLGEDAPELTGPPGLATGVPAELLANRPDVRAAYLRVEAADARVAAAVADRFPSFNLVGDYGGASRELSGLLDSPNVLWNLLLSAAVPVIDGGRRRAEVERTEAVVREALAAYREAVLGAMREVEDAVTRVRTTTERIDMLTARVEASEGALRLSLDRYMQGISDYLPVLDAQQRFFDSKSALLAARRQLVSDHIGLARALGGEWPGEIVSERMAMELKGKERD